MQNTHKKNADILSYSVDNKITKKIILDNDSELSEPEGFFYYNDDYSNTLTSFEDNMPSATLSNIEDNISIMEKIIENHKNNINNSVADDYFNNVDSDIKDKIIEGNKDDIKGSTDLEAIVEIEKLIEEFNAIKQEYTYLVYGKDSDTKSACEIDATYLEKLKQNEKENKYEYNNYYSLYFESQISYVIRSYLNSVFDETIDLHSIKDELECRNEITPVEKRVLNNEFTIIVKSQNNNNYKDSFNSKEILTSLNNIFKKKNDLNIYNSLFSNLFTLADDSDFYLDIEERNEHELYEFTDDFVKSFMKYSREKTSIKKILLKKQKIRSFFKNTIQK